MRSWISNMEVAAATFLPWGLRQTAGIALGILSGLAALLLSDGGTFTAWSFFFWLAGLASMVVAFLPLPSSVRLRLPRPEAAAARRFFANPWLWAVLAVTALGAFLRLYQLTEITPGIAGDEAWTGINGRRILEEGWIGAYVMNGLGVPSGPLYLVAPFVGILGDTVLAIRLPMALLGIATIPVAYLAFTEMAGRKAALIGAFILAVSMWHIHLSRMAWPVISWPLIEMATIGMVFWGFRSGRRLPFLLAGIFIGFGALTYNAYPAFVAVLSVFMVWALIRGQPMQRRELLGNLVLLSIAVVIAALPMIREALDSTSLIRNDAGRAPQLIFNSLAYQQQETFVDQLEFLASKGRDYFLGLTWKAKLDAVEVLGLTPILDRFTIVLALAGLAYMAVHWRRLAHVLVWMMILALPLLAILTVDGMYRRTFGLVPFISLAAAIPLAFAWEHALKLNWLRRWAVLGAMVVILGLLAQVNVVRYFDTLPNEPSTSWSFVEDLTRSSEYVADLPGRPYIYQYSGRFFFAYETQRFLAPDRPGEDRSREHGQFTLQADRTKDVVFLFLAPYFDLLPQVQALHPGGMAHEQNGSNGQLLFRAYYLPRQADAASSPASPR